MIHPSTKVLSKTILESIEMDKIVYAEVTPTGAMGNSGGIIMYIIEEETDELICYETSIFDDEETYLLAEKKLFEHLDEENPHCSKEHLYFDFYYGGMGNNVFISKKVKLTVKDNYFVYTEDDREFQILSFVQGVFNSVVHQLENNQKK